MTKEEAFTLAKKKANEWRQPYRVLRLIDTGIAYQYEVRLGGEQDSPPGYRLVEIVNPPRRQSPEIVCCRYLGTCGHSLDPDSYCGVNHCSPHDRTERCELFGCVPCPTKQMDGYFEMRMIDRARVDPVLTRDTQETPAQRGQHGRAK
jgi:hypothetical protein